MPSKKIDKFDKEDAIQKENESAGHAVMSSLVLHGNVISSLHQKSDFGKNDYDEDVTLDFNHLMKTMGTVSAQVKNGDLSELEEMLVCQSFSLQNLFMTMANKIEGTSNTDHIELYTRLALKAQNQCRTTIASLSEMKNPKRATFIKQLNQANQMQVNNNENSDSKNLKNNDNLANELLEDNHGERLDTGKTQETIGINQQLEAMETVNRC